MKRLLSWMKRRFFGGGLTDAITRNAEAADALDAAVKEILKQ